MFRKVFAVVWFTFAMNFVFAQCISSKIGIINVSASNGNGTSTILPGTNGGIGFDITALDNSFNLTVNGTPLCTGGVELQYSAQDAGNFVVFSDGFGYGQSNYPDVWTITSSTASPLIRVQISNAGVVQLWGSQFSGGPLMPMQLSSGAFNIIPLNMTGTNNLVIAQSVDGPTYLMGNAYSFSLVNNLSVGPDITGICAGGPATLSGNPGGGTWAADVTNPAGSVLGTTDAFGKAIINYSANAAIATYKYIYNLGFCSVNETVALNAAVQPVFSFKTAYCFGATTTPLPTISDNGITGTWTPSSISAATAGSTTYTFTPASEVCTLTKNITVSIAEPLQPIFSFETAYCTGATPASLPATSDNGITGTWSPSTISTAAAFSGNTSYSFSPNAGQCAANNASLTIAVAVPILPFSLGADTILCHGEQLLLKPGISLNNTYPQYLWQNGSSDMSFLVQSTGLYHVTVSNACASFSDTIKVDDSRNCQLFVPNAFTPNEDGLNDFFRVVRPFPVSYFSMTIYNRWGQKIYDGNSIYAGWDGTYRGLKQLAGAYVWIINLVDKAQNKTSQKGTVMLIR